MSLSLRSRVVVDGDELGELVRIETHPARRVVMLVTEHEDLRVELTSIEDATTLAAALEPASRLAEDR